MTESTCAACRASDLEPGVLLDTNDNGGLQAGWIPGEAQFGPLGGLKFRTKERYAVEAYRCGNCGFLNLYVPAQNFPDENGAVL